MKYNEILFHFFSFAVISFVWPSKNHPGNDNEFATRSKAKWVGGPARPRAACKTWPAEMLGAKELLELWELENSGHFGRKLNGKLKV